MQKPFIAAQGDVLIRPARPEAIGDPIAPDNGRVVLAYGEVTGHHHSFRWREGVNLFRDAGGGSNCILSISDGPAMLEHQEHDAIPVPPGTYEVIQQRTFDGAMVERSID